jgi:uncharacterized FAD-dependent dehydrogenase
LRLFPVWHVGTDYLSEIAKNWYDYLVSKGVQFYWETKVKTIDFNFKEIFGETTTGSPWIGTYDELIFAVGKSGIDFAQELQDSYKLETEPKSVQIGVRFEAPQHHFQKLIDISYDFKLYRKFDTGVSLRSFCTNNNAAYVAVEETYGDVTYNGHAKKDPKYLNGMTNFGIIMEIKDIDNPFEWSRKVVNELQYAGTGLYYSPSRKASTTSEGEKVSSIQIDNLDIVKHGMGEYWNYIEDFINDMKKVFPTLQDDWGVYVPEVKYLSPEPLVYPKDLALVDFPNVHFVGDALSARGITVSGAQGILSVEKLINTECPWDNIQGDIINWR